MDRREALLEAAEHVFSDKGLAAATVADITSRAGVAKGTFYLYFSSKDDILVALQGRIWEGMFEALSQAYRRLQDSDDGWAVVDTYVETVVDYDLAHRDWHRLVAQGWAPSGPELVEREERFIKAIIAVIETGIAKGQIHASDPELMATLLYRAVEGTSHQLCMSEVPVDRDRLVRGIQEFLHKALAPQH